MCTKIDEEPLLRRWRSERSASATFCPVNAPVADGASFAPKFYNTDGNNIGGSINVTANDSGRAVFAMGVQDNLAELSTNPYPYLDFV